ncbi:MAG: hypothetical protein AB7I19_10995 [Planctomycetota bacterium]
MTLLFVANLDAELELENPDYRRSAAMGAQILTRAAALQQDLVRAYGVPPRVVLDGEPHRAGDQFTAAVAWCATPRARTTLAIHGFPTADAPSIDVLATVNHRAFGLELARRHDLPSLGERFVTSLAECEAVLLAAPDQHFVLKRPFGFAGRARKVMTARDLGTAARTWIEASMPPPRGGLLIEPFVPLELDVSIHGWVDAAGAVRGGRPVVLTNDHAGAFWAARVAEPGELTKGEVDALVQVRDLVGAALHCAGYLGPFGIDGFRWRDRGGALRFRPLVEINARYTMAYWRGMVE